MFSYIYLFFAAFYGSSISAILPFHLCPPPPLSFSKLLPCQCTSPYPFTLHSTLIFICTNIFLACSSFLLFLFPAVPVLLFFAFSFASAWFYCPIRFVKHFTFVAHMNFKFLKMFQSFRSLLLCRCMCVCVCVPLRSCVCGQAGGRHWRRQETSAEMLIVRKTQCALPLCLLPPLPIFVATHVDRNDF